MALFAVVAVETTGHAEPLTLRAAIDLAVAHHPSLARDTAQRASAAARIGATRAAFLPHLNLQASSRDDYVDPSNFLSSANMLTFGNEFIYSGQVAVDQLVTDSGLTGAKLDGAIAGERRARDQIAISRLDVEAGVAQAYLDVLRDKELVAVSTAAVGLVQEQLQRATTLFKASARPEIDVLSAQTQLAQAELSLRTDENAVQSALVALQGAIGADKLPDLDVMPVDIAPLAEEGKLLDQLTGASLSRRPELAAIREDIHTAEAGIRAAQAETLPRVSVQAGVYSSGGVQPPLLGLATWTPSLGVFGALTVNWDLYIGGANRYHIADAHAQAQAARAELVLEQQSITRAVSQAALAVSIARDALAIVTTARSIAERQLKLAQARYQTGMGNFVELNDARTSLVNVQRQEVEARYALAQSRISLARELGRGAAELATSP